MWDMISIDIGFNMYYGRYLDNRDMIFGMMSLATNHVSLTGVSQQLWIPMVKWWRHLHMTPWI